MARLFLDSLRHGAWVHAMDFFLVRPLKSPEGSRYMDMGSGMMIKGAVP
jgi:hypothetical protein